jgi:TolB protein
MISIAVALVLIALAAGVVLAQPEPATGDCAPLELSCPPDLDWDADEDVCTVTSTLPQLPVVVGGCGQADVVGVRSDGLALGAPWPLGTTTITWTATDQSGATASGHQLVVVKDVYPPGMKLPENVILSCGEDTSPDGRAGWATAWDNCDPEPKISYYDTWFYEGYEGCERDCAQEYMIVRNWMAIDDSGNPRYGAQEIRVQDRVPPVIQACAADRVVCADENLKAIVPDMRAEVVATDDCSEPVVVLQDPAPGTVVGVGIHKVTFTVADQCGNESVCEASFEVRTGEIRAFKFQDANGNGKKDEGESALSGWTMSVYNVGGAQVASGQTGANGWVTFSNLPCGEYTVVETMQAGWQNTTPLAQKVTVSLESAGYAYFGNEPLRQCPTCRKSIVFQSDRVGGNQNIFKMDLDGANVQQLTDDPADDIGPDWSSDGMHIAFASERDGDWEIYWMWHDGRDQTNVTNLPGSDEMSPNWNCEEIVYQSDAAGNWEIYKINPMVWQAQPMRLTQNAAEDVAPSWSPDSQTIAFQSNRDGDANIYLMRPDGTHVRRLTTSSAEDRNPAWLATAADLADIRDGGATVTEHSKWVVFESDRGTAGQFDLYRIHIDTGEVVQLTSDPADDLNPVGMPYCGLIVFESDRGVTDMDVWKMDLDGEDDTNVTIGDSPPDPWFDAVDEVPPTPTPTPTPTLTPSPTPEGSKLYLPLVSQLGMI